MNDTPDGLTTLQSLIFPEPGICTERPLYLRLHGAAGISRREQRVEFASGGEALFDTYFNLFNLGKWQKHCGLTDIRLVLRGSGRFEISVFQIPAKRSFERLYNEVLTLSPDEPLELDLSSFSSIDRGGVLHFELRALESGFLEAADWKTSQQPLRQPDLVLSITTFRREEAVRRSAERFQEFIETSRLKGKLHLLVVDNGQSAEIEPSEDVTLIENENLGGSGGFTRGLLEAKGRGATHCLFMDDDAMIHMETLDRTWMFLAYATAPSTCVSGALSTATDKWQVWENGALFNSVCIRVFGGVDLRDYFEVLEMENESAATPTPHNFYGGWWFFAFPIDQVEYLPFPFFVRGDDVSFGLVHDFNSVTLPGVITFQDEDFSNKETAQTLYLDLRSHLAHHLSIPHMEIGKWRTCRIAAWFFGKSLIAFHYETLEALNMAFEDVMRGPEFFAENIDMSQRRADIKQIMQDEAPKPAGSGLPAVTPEEDKPNLLFARFMKYTLNGHLLPLYKVFGKHVVVRANERWQFYRIWGASRITYVDAEAGTTYTVTHSKVRAFKQLWRLMGNSWRLIRDYDRLKAEWQDGYRKMTTETFWREKLGQNKQAEDKS